MFVYSDRRVTALAGGLCLLCNGGASASIALPADRVERDHEMAAKRLAMIAQRDAGLAFSGPGAELRDGVLHRLDEKEAAFAAGGALWPSYGDDVADGERGATMELAQRAEDASVARMQAAWEVRRSMRDAVEGAAIFAADPAAASLRVEPAQAAWVPAPGAGAALAMAALLGAARTRRR